MNLENIPDEKLFWGILLLAGVFLLALFIFWVIQQIKNKTE